MSVRHRPTLHRIALELEPEADMAAPQAAGVTPLAAPQTQRVVQQQSGARVQRLVRTALLALPLLSLVVLFALACGYHPPRPQTGDALLDAVLQDVDRPGLAPWTSAELGRLKAEMPLLLVPGRLTAPGTSQRLAARAQPASLLSQLDERFTSDPRYWTMLYYSASFTPPADAVAELKARGLTPNVWFLEEAQRRGVASVELLTLQLDALDDHWGETTRPAATTQSGVAHEWPVEQWRARQAAFKADSAAQLPGLLDQLLKVGAASPGAHYIAARYAAECGDLDRAQALIAQGNRLAPVDGFTTRDPAGVWQAAALPAQTWIADRIALGDSFTRPLPNFLRWKNVIKQLAYAAAQRNDRAALQELHTFACRLGQNGGPVVITQLVGVVYVGLIADAVQNFAPQALTTADMRGLSERTNRRDKLKSQVRTSIKGVSAFGFPNTTYGGTRFTAQLGQAEVDLSPEAAVGIEELNVGHEMELREQAIYAQTVPLWADLAAFDYRTMSAPPATAPAVPGAPAIQSVAPTGTRPLR